MFVLIIVTAYLLGSIPVGYLLARMLKGIDIRRHGSGNIGATNVFRVISPRVGLAVLVLDILKGLIPVIFLGNFALRIQLGPDDEIMVRLILALAAVCGHNWPIFLKFKGGKGVATTAGALLGLTFTIPQLGLILGLCLWIWVLAVLITGFVSLGSILAALSLPVFLLVFNQPLKLLFFSVVLCLFLVYRHKSNIGRLLRCEEKNIFRL